MKNEMKNDEAVSPVIATILMVAITVVLAGVLYVWASDLASQNQTDGPAFYTISATDHTAQIEGEDAAVLTASFGGGDDLNWAMLKIELVEDSNTVLCDNPGKGTTDSKCVVSIPSEYGETDVWDKGETMVVTEGVNEFCSSAAEGVGCTVTLRVLNDGDSVMSAVVTIN